MISFTKKRFILSLILFYASFQHSLFCWYRIVSITFYLYTHICLFSNDVVSSHALQPYLILGRFNCCFLSSPKIFVLKISLVVTNLYLKLCPTRVNLQHSQSNKRNRVLSDCFRLLLKASKISHICRIQNGRLLFSLGYAAVQTRFQRGQYRSLLEILWKQYL